MRHLILPVVILALLVAATPAPADQTDSRLKALFSRLQMTKNPSEAQLVEGSIWQIWLETKDAQVERKVAAGVVAMNRGDLKAALALFDDVIKQAPTYAEGWNKRATIHFMMDDYGQSLSDVAHTLALEPRHFGALSGMGLIYHELGDDAKALKAMEKALELNPLMPGLRERVEGLREEVEGKAI
jgi:tetratricopeptide (TPR) repeat protein